LAGTVHVSIAQAYSHLSKSFYRITIYMLFLFIEETTEDVMIRANN
jgi:hypothetical protein